MIGKPDSHTYLSLSPHKKTETQIFSKLSGMTETFHITHHQHRQAERFFLYLETKSPDGKYFPHFTVWNNILTLSGWWIDMIVENRNISADEMNQSELKVCYMNERVPNVQNYKLHKVPGKGSFSVLMRLNWGENVSSEDIIYALNFLQKPSQDSEGDVVKQLYWQRTLTMTPSNMEQPENILNNLISLPGVCEQVTIQQLSVTGFKHHVHVYWLHKTNKKQFFTQEGCFGSASALTNTFCRKYLPQVHEWGSYIYIRKSFSKEKPTPKYKTKKSWKNSVSLCVSIGGSLPITRSKEELNELITLSRSLVPYPGLFIGVVSKTLSKVSQPNLCRQ